jgi:hypothetical protein
MAQPTQRSLTRFVLLVLGIVYLVQAATPLRLNNDAQIYLSLAESVAGGHGLLYHDQPTHYPPLLPILYAGLIRLHLADSCTFVLVNCAFLAMAVAVLRSPMMACFVLLCSGVIKHVTLPVSDVMFMGLSMLCLWLAVLSARQRQWPLLVMALNLAVAATATRTIGVALFPAILYPWLREIPRAIRWLLLGVGVIVVGLFVLPRLAYTRELIVAYGILGFGHAVCYSVHERLTELGLLAINFPSAHGSGFLIQLLWIVGAIVLAIIVCAGWRRRRAMGPADIYLICYAAIMFVWPYPGDVRFWLPVLPLLMDWVASVIPRKAIAMYLIPWTLIGLAFLAASTRQSLAGRDFDQFYGNDAYKASYRIAVDRARPGDESAADPEMVDLLGRYTPNAAK